jgi:hypothetical protein
MAMLLADAGLLCSMIMLQGSPAWTNSIDKQLEPCSMDMQIGDMGMQPCGQSSKNSGTALADYFFTVNLQTHEKIMRNCRYAVAEQNFSKKDTDLKLRTA